MAYADYTHCDVCDRKAFYDANINWESQYTGQVGALCLDCSKTHELKVVPRETPLAEAHTIGCDGRYGGTCDGEYCLKPAPAAEQKP